MAVKVQILDSKGAKAEELKLESTLLSTDRNEALVHQAVRTQLANRRTGNADTKTRGQVSGGGAKPWRQKGTGRARSGSIRAPQFTGGGVVFGPSPRSYEMKMNRKARRKAFASALTDKLASGSLFIIKSLELDELKTKKAAALLSGLGISGKRVVLVLTAEEEGLSRAFLNLPGTLIRRVDNVSTYDVLNGEAVLMSVAGLKKMEETRS